MMDSIFEGAAMAEPVTTAAGVAGGAWKFGLGSKLAALFGIGAVGAFFMAVVDPPKTRRMLFVQAGAAGSCALIFTPAAVRVLDAATDWIDLAGASVEQWAEVALPVGFLVGSLSWGGLGALVVLRRILRERGPDALARRVGLDAGAVADADQGARSVGG